MGLFLLIFTVSLAVAGFAIYLLVGVRWNQEKRRVHKQLKQLTVEKSEREMIDITRQRRLSNVPFLNRFLLGIQNPRVHAMDRLVLQSGSKYPLGFFVLLTCVLFMAGFLLVALMTRNAILPALTGLILGFLPYYYLCFSKAQRLNKLQEQLPDALDMVARALKAGHALSRAGSRWLLRSFRIRSNRSFTSSSMRSISASATRMPCGTSRAGSIRRM